MNLLKYLCGYIRCNLCSTEQLSKWYRLIELFKDDINVSKEWISVVKSILEKRKILKKETK